MNSVTICSDADEIVWGLTTSKSFTTNSFYKFTLGGGGGSPRMGSRIWKCMVPLKIRIFVCQSFQDRFQTASQLKTRKWKGIEYSRLCCYTEDINHLLFTFPLAEFCWALVS
jgi:hypothetical protein